MDGLEPEPRWNSSPLRWAWLAWALCIFCQVPLTALGQTTLPGSVAGPIATPAANPHWSPDGCGTCHQMRGGKASPIAAESVTQLCLSCHDGERASAEIHPIGKKMEGRAGPNPLWPTLNGALDCVTCHDARQECDPAAAAQPPDTNAAFLRQTQIPAAVEPPATPEQPPAAETKPFCDNCHAPEQTPKFNPHMMLADDRHTVIEQRCQVCHDKPMNRNATTRSSDSSLRADQVSLCRSCHPHHKDISRAGHVQTTIQPAMLIYMRARELTGLLETPSPDLLKQLEDDKALPTLMVPDAQGKIVCSTCHNPHEQGTFAANCVLDDRSLRLVKGHLLTPVRGQIFCRRCHNF